MMAKRWPGTAMVSGHRGWILRWNLFGLDFPGPPRGTQDNSATGERGVGLSGCYSNLLAEMQDLVEGENADVRERATPRGCPG